MDNEPWFGLPKPFAVPCADGMFQEMYYWDSYFTNRGLLLDGEIEQAKNNVENLCYMVRRFGFVLNGNRREFLNNSQPPFLSQMAREVYAVTGERAWLAEIYPDICAEHKFWWKNRTDATGLAHYDAVLPLPDWQVERGAELFFERLGYTPDPDRARLARGLFAVGESGWDINPRMTYRGYELLAVELNSLLYSLEGNLAYFAAELGLGADAEKWSAMRDGRADSCRSLLLGEDGVFYDYDTGKGELNYFVSAACFYPLYFGMATEQEARTTVKKALPLLETEWGTVTSVPSDERGIFQWGYPNGWPPMQCIIVGGLLRYGYTEDARWIAGKFLHLLEKCFAETGHLWEKYNVVAGNCDATVEYETPAMLGWTYGVYREFSALLKN